MNINLLMKRAISLADSYKLTTKPNPVVGCLLIKDNKVISEGAHELYGQEHAEINALKKAFKKYGNNKKFYENVEMIVTLEPCSHHGKTGPCTEAILNSGIKKVYIGTKDPNPKVCGKGIDILRKNNIEVHCSYQENEIIKQNEYFFFKHKYKKPYITVKIASSKDGKAYIPGEKKWITSSKSRKDVQIERSKCDAIITGGNTLINDNPYLNLRLNKPSNQHLRIVMTKKKDLDMSLNFFRDKNFEIYNEYNQKKFINWIKKKDVNHLMVEGGPIIVNSFLESKNINKLIYYKSDMLLGKNGIGWFNSSASSILENEFVQDSVKKISKDEKITYIKND